ncbi:MAG: FMN-binding negative transcriptional regulator [Alphaproteobacteria bacterium]|nr:FMN-binding negative transcriptional regulator [Alphaproteobacteria bacterium]
MYIPKHFAMDALSDQHALIEACDFGVVVSHGADGLFATHIPLMLKRDEGAFGTLYGHLARSNPHVGLLGTAALVVFSGPHAYVSPSWFSDRSMNVPTWNYSAVHCSGVPQATGGDQLVHLREMAQRYEAARPSGWSVDELKADMRESLPRGIVTFRMEIARIEGKAKLSQNKPRGERERVIEGLKADGEAKLAARMVQELEKA